MGFVVRSCSIKCIMIDVLFMFLTRSRHLRDDRFVAPGRTLMEKTVQTTVSSAADRGHCQPLLHRNASVTKSCHLISRRDGHIFCCCRWSLSRPLQDDRFAAPGRALMEKTVLDSFCRLCGGLLHEVSWRCGVFLLVQRGQGSTNQI